MFIQLLSKTAVALYFLAAISPGQVPLSRKSEPPGRVLPLIERYKAPPYPKSSFLDRETYDYRVKYRRPVPATLTDVFICDIWQRITLDLKLELEPSEATAEVVKQALGVYLQRGWNDIAGYRPWTHWNFIRRLKNTQRDALAVEAAEYIRKNGVRDVKEDKGARNDPRRPDDGMQPGPHPAAALLNSKALAGG